MAAPLEGRLGIAWRYTASAELKKLYTVPAGRVATADVTATLEPDTLSSTVKFWLSRSGAAPQAEELKAYADLRKTGETLAHLAGVDLSAGDHVYITSDAGVCAEVRGIETDAETH